MKLLNKKIEDRFAEVGSQQEVEDPIIIVKFFYPLGPQKWFATEYDPEQRTFFGYVTLFGLGSPKDEWGYFSLDELQQFKGQFGMLIERDIGFGEKKISEVIKKL